MFEVNRTLLNPKFEGYKFDPLDQDRVISRYPLPYTPTQTTVSGRSPLAFQEVQSRIRHNHLAIGPYGRAAYVDAELKVVGVALDDVTLAPIFSVLYELPHSIQTSPDDKVHKEYASLAFLDEATMLVSDGLGSLHLLDATGFSNARLINFFDLVVPESFGSAKTTVPFKLHLALRSSPTKCIAILSSKHYPLAEQSTNKRANLSNIQYDIWAVSINFELVSRDESIPLDILWHRRGTNVPISVSFDTTRRAFILIGNSTYRPLNTPPAPSYTPTTDEIAPIPRAEEHLDATRDRDIPTKPPPYSWTQTNDTVTVAFPLPAPTSKKDIKITFSPRTLSLLVHGSITEPPFSIVPLPRYATAALWDGIQSSTSYWTWDREAEHTFGLLTLYLDKQHEGTRWSQVFAASGTKPTTSTDAQSYTDPESIEVPETLDPSELYHIRESLEKYTAAIQKGEDPSGLGLGHGIPSLGEGEIDEEIDSDIGDSVLMTWVGEDGDSPSWSSNLGMDTLLSLLSTPLQEGINDNDDEKDSSKPPVLPSLIIKSGVDGAYFTLQAAKDPISSSSLLPPPPVWQHTSTFSALSFVLASKRDTRFVHHVGSRAVLAFESGARELGGNVYIYRNTTRLHDKYAQQTVLKIGGGAGGSLLGVGLLKPRPKVEGRDGDGDADAGGKVVICCLCEGEMVIMRAEDVL